jgi:valyl-tRNA synthetase
MTDLPKKLNHSDIEKKWQSYWKAQGTYNWDAEIDRDKTFSIDTPPPTVSGSLHIGHVFSYTHTDLLARYQRMTGKNVFYPMGWDDNGLPTERRVQNVFGINCNPKLPYDPDWTPQERSLKPHEYDDISRQNFIETCALITQKDEAAFESLWQQLGLSVDWNQHYATIDNHCRKTSQYSFLELVEKGHIYQHEAPTIWDIDFQTAVAQAELEDREKPGETHDIQFDIAESNDKFVISTTRPELLAACIAVVAHPDDQRYQGFFGKYAITPLFQSKVPILPATHADPEKGTGILMICTFGDINDVDWWKQSKLPIKQIISRNGTFRELSFGEEPFNSEDPKSANRYYSELKGLRPKKAKATIVAQLKQTNALVKDPESITHPVKFYEKGDTPIEFISTRQWFINILDHKKDLLKQGEKIAWHPPHMKSRYDNWVDGLNQDWCISRQRYFGVPFPVWYPLNDQCDPNYSTPIYASVDQLPVDPLSQAPSGYTESQRNQPHGFTGDPDVMDTWATSSLTPQLMSHWTLDKKRHDALFPMDIRPQSHEIIRTWAFYTIVKAWFHSKKIPWKHVTISGWILDPDRKKMSKSKGNVVTPTHLLNDYSSDAVRYWAAKARLGADTTFDEGVLMVGKKLSNKLFNASKFVIMQLSDYPKLTITDITQPIDLSFVYSLKHVIIYSTKAFEKFDYASALAKIETHFWQFCDHYIELVKGRAYREEDPIKKKSALATLDWALKTYLRLFAPYMPYITEEIWSWRYSNGSIHKAAWPSESELTDLKLHADQLFEQAIIVLTEVRSAKSKANTSMKHPVNTVTIHSPEDTWQNYDAMKEDIIRAGSIASLTFQSRSTLRIDVELHTGV